jgi:hypothetical protein
MKMAGSYSAVNQLLSEHADCGSRLRARTFSPGPEAREPHQTFVLLEGNREALSFLAHLILAHLETDVCSVSLHPLGAGKSHFSEDSDIGVYIHRLPCEHSTSGAVAEKADE